MAAEPRDDAPAHLDGLRITILVASILATIAALVGIRLVLDPSEALGAPVPASWRIHRGEGFALALPGAFGSTRDPAILQEFADQIGITGFPNPIVLAAEAGEDSDPDASAAVILRLAPEDPAELEKQLGRRAAADLRPVTIDGHRGFRSVERTEVDGAFRAQVNFYVLSDDALWMVMINLPDRPDALEESNEIATSFVVEG